MKYIKSFNESNSESLYEEISKEIYDNRINIHGNDIDIPKLDLENLNKNGFLLDVSKNIDRKYSKIYFKGGEKKYKFTITYSPDEWYYIQVTYQSIIDSNSINYYKCDSIDGLISLLKNKKELLSKIKSDKYRLSNPSSLLFYISDYNGSDHQIFPKPIIKEGDTITIPYTYERSKSNTKTSDFLKISNDKIIDGRYNNPMHYFSRYIPMSKFTINVQHSKKLKEWIDKLLPNNILPWIDEDTFIDLGWRLYHENIFRTSKGYLQYKDNNMLVYTNPKNGDNILFSFNKFKVSLYSKESKLKSEKYIMTINDLKEFKIN